MTNIIKFPAKPVATATNHFGGCPHCDGSDGYLNIGREHWFFCARHKTKWHGGSNLFSGWREESEDTWRRNRFRLAEYVTVAPRQRRGA